VSRVYLDACCIIYLIEAASPFHETVRSRPLRGLPLRELRQIIGDRKPSCLAGDKDVCRRANSRIVVQASEGYAILEGGGRINRS